MFPLILGGQSTYSLNKAEMTIEGTSSLHDWTSDVTKVEAKATMSFGDQGLQSIDELYVEIPVEGIQSEKGSMMDKKTYKALESDDHPNITFKLTKVNSATADGLKATGVLTIAGNARTIDMTVKSKKLTGGAIQFTGSKSFKMTDFGIDPPTALLGTLKTGDEVTIKFNVTFSSSKS